MIKFYIFYIIIGLLVILLWQDLSYRYSQLFFVIICFVYRSLYFTYFILELDSLSFYCDKISHVDILNFNIYIYCNYLVYIQIIKLYIFYIINGHVVVLLWQDLSYKYSQLCNIIIFCEYLLCIQIFKFYIFYIKNKLIFILL